MSFKETILNNPRPSQVRPIPLPRRTTSYFPSPASWQDQVFYFLLPDRFSNGQETNTNLLDRSNVAAARPSWFRFDHWAQSGGERWQGGNLKGIESKLDYLSRLGVTVLWIAPVFKQRGHLDTYHGYGIQDFLEVGPHFGTRKDLVDLVEAAHQKGIRIVLDIVFNHSGRNWIYGNGQVMPPYKSWPYYYSENIQWLDRTGAPTGSVSGGDEGVWPNELLRDDYYTRAGRGSLGGEDILDDRAEMRRTDFEDLRDFNFDGSHALDDLARCYKCWIALTDCDGFRLDTLKHVPLNVARDFCGTIKEFATNLGKSDFFLLGEVAGSDENPLKYLEVLGHNLNATLDIGSMRRKLHAAAKGLIAPREYFDLLRQWDDRLGSHRDSAGLHVIILDDHDHVSGDKVRFSSDASSDHQVVAAAAIQFFSLGIPCIYYGTEQAFAGPEKSERDKYLPDYNVGDPQPDKYLREAMFGPEHPLKSGLEGLQTGTAAVDTGFPGFGPFGTVGKHCFDPAFPTYVRIAHLTETRSKYPVLRHGRQYLRPISNFNAPFQLPNSGELIAWSRILDDEEALIVVNGRGSQTRGGDVVVDADLNQSRDTSALGPFFEVVANTQQAATPGFTGTNSIGTKLSVKFRDGSAYIEIRDLQPSEVIVLINKP